MASFFETIGRAAGMLRRAEAARLKAGLPGYAYVFVTRLDVVSRAYADHLHAPPANYDVGEAQVTTKPRLRVSRQVRAGVSARAHVSCAPRGRPERRFQWFVTAPRKPISGPGSRRSISSA